MTYAIASLSPRAQRAIKLLADGAQFVIRLERDSYTQREQFKYRLLHAGRPVKGYGHATYHELESMLVPASKGTSVSSYYKLRA